MAAKAKTANKMPRSNDATTTNSNEKVHSLPLTDIFADKRWNARSAVSANTTDVKGDAGDLGYPGLVSGIAKDGQSQPVVVRPNPNFKANSKKESERPYFLCSGFQRYQAIEEIASKKADAILLDPNIGGMNPADVYALHNDKPTIKAFVRNYSDAEARRENITENTQRSALSTPDICFAVLELKNREPKMTQAVMASILNNNQSYVGKLLEIGNVAKSTKIKLPNGDTTTILDHWRTAPFKPTVKVMYENVAKEENADKRAAAYIEAAKVNRTEAPDEGEGGGEGGEASRGKRAWFTKSKEAAEKIGTNLGYMSYHDMLDIEEDTCFSPENLPLLILPLKELNKKCTPDEAAELADVARAAYVKAKKEGFDIPSIGEDAEDEEAEEVIRVKQKNKANGAAAAAS